ncbi:MAG: LysM peptidoglycan-binding domain-containing protein [Myxococcaceae bacterium]
MPLRVVVCLITGLVATRVLASPEASAPDAGGAAAALSAPDAGLAPIASGGVEAEAGLEADEPAEDEVEDAAAEEGEAEAPGLSAVSTDGGLLYSADLSDAELERRWTRSLEALGSISVGFAEAGRVINGVALRPGEALTVVVPEAAWGTQEVIDAVAAAAGEVHEKFPAAPPLRVNHISKREGGYLRPHVTHQSGRDVDLGFFYRDGLLPGAVRGPREKLMDVAQNWALVRALVTRSDVQVILVDRRIQKVLYGHALAAGEDKAWLEQLFHSGRDSLLQHARRHRDHFHVRFFAGRSQELGRRVQPLLAKRPEENIVIHRVRRGDTLGQLAHRYGSSVRLIQKANRMSNTRLSIGRTLNVPLRGPCTLCPLPPPVRVPPRRLPPDALLAAVSAPDGGAGALGVPGGVSPPDAGSIGGSPLAGGGAPDAGSPVDSATQTPMVANPVAVVAPTAGPLAIAGGRGAVDGGTRTPAQ